MPSNIIPITRISKWFSKEDFDLEVAFSREFIEGDGNFTVILYRVDRENSEYDAVYGEASKDGIKYFPPVELKVFPKIDEPENKAYNSNGTNRYLQDGKLSFGIYQAQLDELDVDINYGDYIGYPITETDVRYFSVSNDGKKFFDNKHTIFGYKQAYRTVLCAPITATEFSAL
jgi:hypothetical protein